MFIQIDDGRKTYEIRNQDGEVVGSVRFDSTDTNILKRADSFLEEIEIILERVKLMDADSGTEEIMELENQITEKINFFFNADVISPFSKIRGLFSPVGYREFFVQRVLESLFKIVNEEFEKEKKSFDRMNEYLDEYTEGEPK